MLINLTLANWTSIVKINRELKHVYNMLHYIIVIALSMNEEKSLALSMKFHI